MTGTVDDGPRVSQTDQALADYTRSLLMPDNDTTQTGFLDLDEVGPLEVKTWAGHSGRQRLVINRDPFDDTEEEEAHIVKRMGPRWRPYAIVLNPEDEWSITFWEPVADARPL